MQQQVLTLLAARGLGVRPDFSYSRVLNGFSAVLDSRAVARAQRRARGGGRLPGPRRVPGVRLVAGARAARRPRSRARRCRASTARGLTIALLDTGVDRKQPYLGGRVEPGLDLVDGTADAPTRRRTRSEPASVERHGTQMAGLLVGSGGPGGLQGVAPGATVFPIRVAGWQPDAEGRSVVYARTDQLIAGLDRAVDPERRRRRARRGADRARRRRRAVRLVRRQPRVAGRRGRARARHARRRAGRERRRGRAAATARSPGPAARAGALTVGATDERPTTATVHVVMRRGLDVVLDEELPLLASARSTGAHELAVVLPRGDGTTAADWFDARGLSPSPAGPRSSPAGEDPGAAALAAAHAGAAAVLVYGKSLPSGSLGISTRSPCRSIARADRARARRCSRRGATATTSPSRIGRARLGAQQRREPRRAVLVARPLLRRPPSSPT